MALTCESDAKSARTVWMAELPLSSVISLSVVASRSGFRPCKIRVAPVWANIRLSSLPMPSVAPVTRTVLPHKSGYFFIQTPTKIIHPPPPLVTASLQSDLSIAEKLSIREGFISSRRSCPYEYFESPMQSTTNQRHSKKGNKIIQCNQTTKPTLLKSRPSLPRK